MRSRMATFLSIGLIAALAACDGATDSTGGLQDTEAAALAAILVGQSLDSGLSSLDGEAQSPAAASARTPFTISREILAEVLCPLGGRVLVEGSIQGTGDGETGDFSVSLDLVQTHDGCRTRHDGTGIEFSVHGDPNVSFQYAMMVENETDLDFLGTMAGRVRWETDDGRSGVCAVDLAYELSGSARTESGSVQLNGEICAAQISQTVSVG